MSEKIRGLFYQYPKDFANFKIQKPPRFPEPPKWYPWSAFVNDVYIMFLNAFNERQGKKLVPHRLGQYSQKMAEQLGMGTSDRWKWAQLNRFFTVFPKTHIFHVLVDTAKNAGSATKRFFELLHSYKEYLEKIRGERVRDLSTLLVKLLHDGDLPIEAFCRVDGGDGVGTGHYSLLMPADMVALLNVYKKIRVRFNWAREIIIDAIPTNTPSDTLEPTPIDSYHDVTHLMPLQQYALDDELFLLKLASKELTKAQHYKYKARPRRIVALIDSSGSMADDYKFIIANASLVALADAVKGTTNTLTVVPFDAGIHEPITGKPEDIKRHVLENGMFYSGGGTWIDGALRKADEMRATDIVLITDGIDNVTYKPRGTLRTILFGNNDALERISDELMRVNPRDLI